MIAFWEIMYLFSSQSHFMSVLYAQKSLCNKHEAVDKSLVASRQGERQEISLKCMLKELRM